MPKISHLLTPMELKFQWKVLICMSATINTAAMEFRYKFYRTCNDIDVVHFASQKVTPPPCKINDMVFKRTQILQWNILVSCPKFPIFWHPYSWTTSQCYAINNTRVCVEYVLILDYFVINYILLWCWHATSQQKSYGYQNLAKLCVIILFNIHSFLILAAKQSYQLLL